MTNTPKKITELTAITTVDAVNDVVPIVDVSETAPAARNKKATVKQLLDQASFTQTGAGAVARTVDSKLKESISVKDFGAVGDGVADDTAAIQAAINAAAAQGGGNIAIPQGRYKITSSLDIISTNVVLNGRGGDYVHDAGNNVDGTTILAWHGSVGGTVIKVRTAPNLATGSKINGSGVKDLEIDCRLIGGIGVLIESVNKVILKRIHVTSPTIAAYKFTTLEKLVDLPEATDVQLSFIEGLSWRCLDVGARNAHGIWLTAHGFPSTGNVSLNVFMNCQGQNYGQTGTTGVGYFIEDGDNINWIRCGAIRAFTDVPAVEIRGNYFTDSHHFYNCTFGGANGIRIKGTASGYSIDPVRCSFHAMDNGNGTQYPVLDAGCRVSYHSDLGVFERARISRLAITDGPADAATQTFSTETLRVTNVSNDHIRLLDGLANAWNVNIDGANGNLRFVRTGGSGSLSVGNVIGGSYSTSGNINFTGTGSAPSNGLYLGAANSLYFLTNSANRCVINSSGRFGINTTSPGTLLEVNQPANSSYVSITSIEKSADTTGGVAGGEFIGSRGDGNDTFFGRLGLGFRRNDGTAIQSGVRVGGLVFGGQHGTGTTYDAASTRYAASVVGVSEGIYTNDTTMATAIAFRTGSTGNDIRAVNSAYGTERARFNKDGQLLIGTTTAGASKLVVNDNSIQINTAKTPASATDTGTTGQIAWDANYVYVCTATNTWKRSAIATW